MMTRPFKSSVTGSNCGSWHGNPGSKALRNSASVGAIVSCDLAVFACGRQSSTCGNREVRLTLSEISHGPLPNVTQSPAYQHGQTHRIQFITTEHRLGLNEQIVGPREREAALNQDVMTVGGGDVSTTSQLQAVQRVPGRFPIGRGHGVAQRWPQVSRILRIVAGNSGQAGCLALRSMVRSSSCGTP